MSAFSIKGNTVKFPTQSKSELNSNQKIIDPQKATQLMKAGLDSDVKQISLKISSDLLARCDAARKEASVTRSSYIKIAILEKLERDGK